MKSYGSFFKKLTLVKAAGYIFVLAICVKGVHLYATIHPLKNELLYIIGIVKTVRLGGDGRATWFLIISGNNTYKCSSYYGKVWPGMERIKPGDTLSLLAERNKLNKNELITGKQYYIWELIHRNKVIVTYDDVGKMVQDIEATTNRFINSFLLISVVFLVIVYLRKLYLWYAKR